MTSFICHGEPPLENGSRESFGDSERERKDTNKKPPHDIWFYGLMVEEIGMSDIIELFNGGEEREFNFYAPLELLFRCGYMSAKCCFESN